MDHPALVRGDQGVGQGDGELENAGKGKPAGGDEVGEGLALDQLHGEEADTVLVLDGVERDDVRVIEPGDRARLALEAGEAIGGGGHRLGQHLHRHLAAEAEVLGPIDLAHPSGSEGAEDLVGAEAGLGGKRHGGGV